jgi:probable blue pigment (indigoidine) exporter
MAALLGWVVLDQTLNHWQILGAVLVLVSVILGQQFVVDRVGRTRDRGRSALPSQV